MGFRLQGRQDVVPTTTGVLPSGPLGFVTYMARTRGPGARSIGLLYNTTFLDSPRLACLSTSPAIHT